MKIKIRESQLKRIIDIISESVDNKLNVLFVGDSLSSAPGYTWNYKLASKNSSKWNSEHLVKGGVRTGWMLDKLRSKLNQDKKYDLVFIYGGTNDMFSLITKNEAISNINKMVDLVAKQGGKTIVFAGYDAEKVMSEKSNSNGGNLKKTIYCSEECMLKSRKKMIEFQDAIPSEISGENVIVIPKMPGGDPSWAGDGTHVGPQVHNKMADYVGGYLTNIPTSPENNDNFYDLLKNKSNLSQEVNLSEDLILYLKNIKNSNATFEFKGSVIADEDIRPIQTGLELLGFYLPIWGIDGKFGNETKKSVKEFQKSLGVNTDGIIDSNLIGKMIDELEDKNLTNADFEKIQIEKTASLSDDETTNISVNISNVNVESNIKAKFKNVLNQNNLSYDDFVSDLNEINLSPDIAIKQLYAESAFSPNIINCTRVSSAGAKGIAQFMPSTWTHYGNGGSPCNVKDSLKAYVKLMRDLIKMFPGRIDLAIAGYNSGPYKQIYKKALNNNIPFNQIKSDIPNETWNYVNKILG
jgi:peptidoglycan hydrolase-like protein with peptidoglycan-binding domain/lysophospholipase L1-like esterase